MTTPPRQPEPIVLGNDTSLETVLAAWHTATVRLEQTHETLRSEVRRLTQELKVKNRELARKNRLADLGQMASHIAHEVRNNLVPVTLYLSLLRRRIASDAEGLRILDKIASGFADLDATVNDLLHFTSDRDPHRQVFSAAKLIDDLLVSLAPQFAAQAIHAVNEVAPDQMILADYDMIRRAVLNLVLNAVDAMPDGGVLRLSAKPGRHEFALQVSDSGVGLSEDALRRAFEPFFTTKPGGTGLGLAIVYRIAEVHGGRVAAAGGPDGGAVFTLTLPRTAQDNAA
ncbi:MAG: HAMP domain-containing histidine kinase [Pirellulales bacterium]|nr:HAMP domain-containing histidine kinase [Pirellulales bacterium]